MIALHHNVKKQYVRRVSPGQSVNALDLGRSHEHLVAPAVPHRAQLGVLALEGRDDLGDRFSLGADGAGKIGEKVALLLVAAAASAFAFDGLASCPSSDPVACTKMVLNLMIIRSRYRHVRFGAVKHVGGAVGALEEVGHHDAEALRCEEVGTYLYQLPWPLFFALVAIVRRTHTATSSLIRLTSRSRRSPPGPAQPKHRPVDA